MQSRTGDIVTKPVGQRLRYSRAEVLARYDYGKNIAVEYDSLDAITKAVDQWSHSHLLVAQELRRPPVLNFQLDQYLRLWVPDDEEQLYLHVHYPSEREQIAGYNSIAPSLRPGDRI
ncbi:unnamed protein product [Trichobilharzia regenti]|nr:unnamed protein product [Trichobilharzia regenti]